jgi:hypothetical protein
MAGRTASLREHERVYRRRRLAALGALVAIPLAIWAVSSIGSGDGAAAKRPPELPRGGRTLLPRYRVVAFYGAPQNDELGVLGIGSPRRAARALTAQARRFTGRRRRPVMPAFELIASIAHAAPGADGMHRQRQTDAVIRSYLDVVHRSKGILILDIQPGRASFLDEARALEPYLRRSDVGLALDPEWSVRDGVAPGEQIGSTDAEAVNEVSAYLASLVQAHDLPQKLLLVHQFTESMVKERKRIAARRGVAIVTNMDGFGGPAAKRSVYTQLTAPSALPSGLAGVFTGFKLFYHEDTSLMRPRQVLRLRPTPDVVVYE